MVPRRLRVATVVVAESRSVDVSWP